MLERMGTNAESKAYEVPALKRAFAILDSLNESSTGLTVQEVRRIHELPYSTAFHLLQTMQACGYVQRDPQSKRYSVGYKLLIFREGAAARRRLSLRALASALMEQLTTASGLTCHLATLEGHEAVYIEKTEPSTYVRLNTWVGKRNSLHCTAVGKALLMHMKPAMLRATLSELTMNRKTERTITKARQLVENLRAAAERGFAVDDMEDEADGYCVAAPIFSAQAEVIAALGLSGLSSQIDASKRDRLAQLVRGYADQISRRLGWTEQRAEVVPVPTVNRSALFNA